MTPAGEQRIRAAVDELAAALLAAVGEQESAGPDRLLSLAEVAKRLGCTRPTLYRAELLAALRPVHVGRRVLVAESNLLAVINGQAPPEAR